MSNIVHVAVVDKAHQHFDSATLHVLWNDFSDQEGTVSLPSYVEVHAARLRTRFAEFVEAVSRRDVGGQSVSQLLLIRNDFSYWWMTLFAATRWDKSSHISDALKLIALSEVIDQHVPDQASIGIENGHIATAIARLLRSRSISVTNFAFNDSSIKRSYGSGRALLSLVKYALTHFRVKPVHASSQQDTLIVDHFVRFDEQLARSGVYQSQYWQPLQQLFGASERNILWLHHFVPGTRSLLSAQRTMDSMQSPGVRSHAQFESRLSVNQLFRVLQDLRKLRKAEKQLSMIPSLFVEERSGIDLSDLFVDQWIDSLRGSTATRHLIMLNQMEDVFASLPRQSLGLFLCENQPWEAALCHAWSTHDHGKLVSVVHAPIRYWDFRYLSLGRALGQIQGLPTTKPLPSLVAVNSPISVDFLNNSGCPGSRVVEVESLMFNHLMQPRQAPESQQTTLLVVGDFFVDQNLNLISLLAGALKIQPSPLNIVFKPHPMNHTIPDLTSLPHAKISNELLGDILPTVHTAVTCNGSTAALECFARGVNTVSVLDPEILNSSPLRSIDGASFVSSVSQLAKAIAQNSSRSIPTTPLVFLDPSLPRWNGLIH